MQDAPRDDDIVELGGHGLGQRLRLPAGWRLPGGRRPPDRWRPSRGAGVLAAAALVVGLAAGYAAGSHQARGVAIHPRPTPAASATPATSFSLADSLALIQDTGACSVQSGRHLALGVQVTNRSTVPVTLQSATAVLPLGGLTPGTWHWTPCGVLPQALAAQADEILLPGASTWLTMTFKVQAACPAADPVQFTVGYLAQGHSATVSLPGFPDLGQVPYSGCPRESTPAISVQFATATPDRGINASR
jgi:hypothetical protein